MFSQDDMQELLAYEANGDGVISIYLDTDSGRQSTEAIKLTAKGLLKEVQTQHEREAQTIERYLDLSYDWSKPGLALFCGQGGSYFRSYPSPVAFRNRIRLGPRPYVKPLAHFLDHYAHFGVIAVDRVNGRFYEYHLGELQSNEGFAGEEVRKVKRGDRELRIGVIPVPSFYQDYNARVAGDDDYRSTTRDVRRLLAEFKAEGGIDGLVLDLLLSLVPG